MTISLKRVKPGRPQGGASYTTLKDGSPIDFPLDVYLLPRGRHSTLKLEWMAVVRLTQDDMYSIFKPRLEVDKL